MARQRRKKAADTSAFSEDAKVEGLEQVAQLANSAAAANAAKGIGHNSGGITDDELKRLIEASQEAKSEVDAAQTILDKANSVYSKSLDVLKNRAGASLKEAVKKYLAEKKARKKEGDGVLVTEQRHKARIMRIMSDPLYTQWSFFDNEEDRGKMGTPSERRPVPAGMEADLQGQHAAHNDEPMSNNPFVQGTENYMLWEEGWRRAVDAKGGQSNGQAGADAAPLN